MSALFKRRHETYDRLVHTCNDISTFIQLCDGFSVDFASRFHVRDGPLALTRRGRREGGVEHVDDAGRRLGTRRATLRRLLGRARRRDRLDLQREYTIINDTRIRQVRPDMGRAPPTLQQGCAKLLNISRHCKSRLGRRNQDWLLLLKQLKA